MQLLLQEPLPFPCIAAAPGCPRTSFSPMNNNNDVSKCIVYYRGIGVIQR